MFEFDDRVKYNFNYLKKNIDIKKFLKLAPKYKVNFNVNFEDLNNFNFFLERALFASCINKNNKDPNLKQERLSQYNLNAQEQIAGRFEDQNLEKEKFIRDGTFFEKIHPNFKLIMHITLGEEKPVFMSETMFGMDNELYGLLLELRESGNFPPFWISPFLLYIEEGENICAHSLIEVKNNNSYSYLHTVYFSDEEANLHFDKDPKLINLFNKKLNYKRFLKEIINFEQKRVEKVRSNFIDFLQDYNSEENLISIYRNNIKTKSPIFTFNKSGKFI